MIDLEGKKAYDWKSNEPSYTAGTNIIKLLSKHSVDRNTEYVMPKNAPYLMGKKSHAPLFTLFVYSHI